MIDVNLGLVVRRDSRAARADSLLARLAYSLGQVDDGEVMNISRVRTGAVETSSALMSGPLGGALSRTTTSEGET